MKNSIKFTGIVILVALLLGVVAMLTPNTPACADSQPGVGCTKTKTPSPTPPTVPPTVTSTLITVVPTNTPLPEITPTPGDTGRVICKPDVDAVCELFTLDNVNNHQGDLEGLERHKIIEDNKRLFKDLRPGIYVAAFWHAKPDGYMPMISFTIRAGNSQTIVEPPHPKVTPVRSK